MSQAGRWRVVTPERPSVFHFCPSQRKSRRYYPTRLAINLSSGVSGAGGTVHQPGFIVVETNYRLYAYTGEAGHRLLGKQTGTSVGRGRKQEGRAVNVHHYLAVYRAPMKGSGESG
jgi:hypothetical protein